MPVLRAALVLAMLPLIGFDLNRRVCDVIQTADGALLVIVDDQKGELLRLTPASPSSR